MNLLERMVKMPSVGFGAPNEFPLPTEVVVTSDQFVSCRKGRYWEVDLYVRDGELLDYDELKMRSDFKGTVHEVQVRLYELWTNLGDDGHCEYCLMGYVFYPGEYPGDPHRIYDELDEIHDD